MNRISAARLSILIALISSAPPRILAAPRAPAEQADEAVYVVGHRSPDIDSVASAIAYAELKARLGQKGMVPAVAGDLDRVSRFVLQRFGFREPARILLGLALRYERVGRRRRGTGVYRFH